MNIRKSKQSDLSQIERLLSEWVEDKDEIKERLEEISDKPDSFFVAVEGEKIVGIMGNQSPDKEVTQLLENPDSSLEIISAFVAKAERGKGIGRALVQQIELEAKQLGLTEIIAWSGPRYRETGWAFYDKLDGFERVGFVDTKEFPVWKKIL